MTRFRFALIAAAVALAFSPIAGAQQRAPQAVSQAGQTVNAAPGAVIVAPAGGGLGKGRPIAEDAGVPLQGRNTTSHVKCTIGLDDTCGIPGPGGGGGDASAANQSSQITLATALNTAIANLRAQLPTVLGSTTKANSLSVTLASDQLLPAFAATPTFNCGTGCTGTAGSPWLPDNGSLLTAAPTGTSSLSSAFPGSGTTVYVKNIGTVPFHFRSVLTSGTALLTDERLQPGMCGPIARNSGDRLALITDSGTGSAEITTGSGNPGFGPCINLNAAAPVVGSIANGVAATDPPVVLGCRASTTNPTAVTDGQVAYVRCGARGDLVVRANAPRDLIDSTVTTVTATTTPATCIAAGGVGVLRDITSITANNTSATDTVFQILDPDGTTVRYSGTAKANDQRGIVLPQVLKMLATNTAWLCKTVTSVSSVVFTLQYATAG